GRAVADRARSPRAGGGVRMPAMARAFASAAGYAPGPSHPGGNAAMKLYFFPGSTTCRPVQMFAAEAGVPLELEAVDLMSGAHLTDAYKAINPNQVVPVLEEPDGFRVVESSAILKY